MHFKKDKKNLFESKELDTVSFVTRVNEKALVVLMEIELYEGTYWYEITTINS